MRCLYCGKQLALFRRLTGGGEFCSDAHKQSYHEEYNRLALTRLVAAQSRPEPKRALSSASNAMPGSPKAANARMLEAPAAESPPPPAPKLIIRKPEVQLGKERKFASLSVEPLGAARSVVKPTWDPAPTEVEPATPPPEAGISSLELMPSRAVPLLDEAANGVLLEISSTRLGPSLPVPSLPVRRMKGFQLHRAVTFNPLDFAPALAVCLEKEQMFERLCLAPVLFTAPSLPLHPRDTASRAVPVAPAKPNAVPATSAESSTPGEQTEPQPENAVEGERKGPSAIKLNPARPPDRTETAPPKLPTIPATRRRSHSPMPSILDPEPQQSQQQNHSLWGAIRKYIHR